MHSDIIDNILEVEDAAVKIVEDAEKQARDIVFNAQSEKKDYIQKEIEKVRARGDEEIDGGKKILDEHLKEYEQQRLEIEKNASVADSGVIARSAERVVRRILEIGDLYGQGE